MDGCLSQGLASGVCVEIIQGELAGVLAENCDGSREEGLGDPLNVVYRAKCFTVFSLFTPPQPEVLTTTHLFNNSITLPFLPCH